MQKIKKILRAISEETALPTNQLIITNNTDLIGPRWRRSKKGPKLANEWNRANNLTINVCKTEIFIFKPKKISLNA